MARQLPLLSWRRDTEKLLITSTPSPTDESDAEVLDQLVALEAHKPGPNDLRFVSGPSPRRSKEASVATTPVWQKSTPRPVPREPPPRVFHVTGTFKDPKDAAIVLSGSR
jgi:hypothetical protein